jgi:hypothetical protein
MLYCCASCFTLWSRERAAQRSELMKEHMAVVQTAPVFQHALSVALSVRAAMHRRVRSM